MFKKVFRAVLVITFLAVSSICAAHEGHDNAPGSIKSNHGGVVKPGKQINLEYVISGNEVKIYPLSHEGKDLTDVVLTATIKVPKGKPEVVKIVLKDNVNTIQIDFKSAYRAEVNIEAIQAGKKSQFKFQVEK